MKSKKAEWVTAREGSTILTRNSGHHVSSDYVRLLANQNKIRSRPVDGRTKEYLKSDLEAYTVTAKKSTTEAEEAA